MDDVKFITLSGQRHELALWIVLCCHASTGWRDLAAQPGSGPRRRERNSSLAVLEFLFRVRPRVRPVPVAPSEITLRTCLSEKCVSLTIIKVISMYAVKILRPFALHCSTCFPKRFEIFIGLLALLAFVFCPTVVAQEQNGWEF